MPRPDLSIAATGLVAALIASPVAAHEFWLEPLAYQVAADGNLVARLVNGSNFDGANIGYFPNRIVDFSAWVNGMTGPIIARPGTTPALQAPAPAEGLVVIGYQSTPSSLTYDSYEVFETFAYHKDLEALAFTHEARGLTRDRVTESYTRFSKTLFGVGNSEGSDIRIGYETEFVLLANPYTDDVSGGMPAQLWYGDEVRANEQVELFARRPGDPEVFVTYHRTDDEGIVMLPVEPGMEYMIDAVILRIPPEDVAMWESLWANETFMIPAEIPAE